MSSKKRVSHSPQLIVEKLQEADRLVIPPILSAFVSRGFEVPCWLRASICRGRKEGRSSD